MKKLWQTIIIAALIFSVLHITASAPYALQSTITESEGYACMGDDKSRKQTEQAALVDAKKNAVDRTATYIKSETKVEDFVVQKDLVEAYQNATVKIIQEVEKNWYKDPSSGDCFKIRIKAEVIPDEKAMEKAARTKDVTDNPAAPLKVQLWTDKQAYKQSEKVRIYLKGNKPFYARVLYRDAVGHLLQLLPNPFRNDNYFNGGVVYEIPSGNDRFDLQVSPPFGEESVLVYASTTPLGEIGIASKGSVYQVKTSDKDIGLQTRGVKLTEKTDGKSALSEFFEDRLVVKTGK
ncbi:MAG: DUF4384 domain-containing protein [Pseudomonadota bacterium]